MAHPKPRRRRWNAAPLAVLTALGLVAACGDGTPTAPPIPDKDGTVDALAREYGLDRYLGEIAPVSTASKSAGWEAYYFGDSTQSTARCFDGDEYVASVNPGDPKKVALVLSGGGACWSYESCYALGPGFAKDESSPRSGTEDGIMNRTRAANAVSDYSFVYGDYCDGSVWSGDNDVTYRSVTDDTERRTYHRGLQNLSATVTLLKDLYPNPDEILVTGSSAGGYGTMMGYLLMRLAFEEQTIRVLNDSGPWLVNPDKKLLFEDAIENWGLAETMLAFCGGECRANPIVLLDELFPRDPNVTIGLFQYHDDAVIGTLFLGYGLDFQDILKRRTDEFHERYPDRFKRFFHRGVEHTIIGSDRFYELKRWDTKLHDWFAGLITDGPSWVDLP